MHVPMTCAKSTANHIHNSKQFADVQLLNISRTRSAIKGDVNTGVDYGLGYFLAQSLDPDLL